VREWLGAGAQTPTRDQANTAMTTSTSTPNAIHCPEIGVGDRCKDVDETGSLEEPQCQDKDGHDRDQTDRDPSFIIHAVSSASCAPEVVGSSIASSSGSLCIGRSLSLSSAISLILTVTGRADGNRLHLQTQGVTENLVQGPSKTSSRMCFETYLETSRFEAPQGTPISPNRSGRYVSVTKSQPVRRQRLLFGLLPDIELQFDLFRPVIGLEARVLEFALESVDVRIRKWVGRQFVFDDVAGLDADEVSLGVARYSER